MDRLGKAELEAMTEEATVDAYNEDEPRPGVSVVGDRLSVLAAGRR